MSTIVLLPGLICDEAIWKAQVKMFNNLGYETLVMDWQDLSDLTEMAKLTLRQAPEQFALIGHSMGGRVALEVLRLQPERITELMLMDTGYLPLTGKKEIDSRMALVTLAKEQGMRTMGERWMQGMVLPEHLDNSQLCNDILDMIERKSTVQFENQQRALIHRPDATDVLSSLTCPTWFVCGNQDTWSPLERHFDMANLVMNSQVHCIEPSGHMTTMEQPDQVNKIMKSWLQYV